MRFLALLFICCCTKPAPVWDSEITAIIQQDAKNKMNEFVCLKEIKIAEENDDRDAFYYFLTEYMKIPRLEIKDEWKTHPDYIEGGQIIKY